MCAIELVNTLHNTDNISTDNNNIKIITIIITIIIL